MKQNLSCGCIFCTTSIPAALNKGVCDLIKSQNLTIEQVMVAFSITAAAFASEGKISREAWMHFQAKVWERASHTNPSVIH